ncbi:hypothetical protein [Planctomicrobium piriforme]|uniref:hypothetical protein n=1 Tax=Planctomicrobium piriforme TaxID=1576369 RepID=UPI0011141E86|nr:hypothetical protein [Planctomicrobium piriforme]
MWPSENSNVSIPNSRRAEFPAIAALRLTAEDWAGLAEQGFVCAEQRGRRSYYKLRFRAGGRQIVRYIGSEERAAEIKSELSRLQAESKMLRELKARTKIANRMLREAKQCLNPVLEVHGLVFHGFAVRRPRRPADRSAHQLDS